MEGKKFPVMDEHNLDLRFDRFPNRRIFSNKQAGNPEDSKNRFIRLLDAYHVIDLRGVSVIQIRVGLPHNSGQAGSFKKLDIYSQRTAPDGAVGF